jgi:hypothetical protein
MALDNLEQKKAKIIFIDNEGFKGVETTHFGFIDKNVMLKEYMVFHYNELLVSHS